MRPSSLAEALTAYHNRVAGLNEVARRCHFPKANGISDSFTNKQAGKKWY